MRKDYKFIIMSLVKLKSNYICGKNNYIIYINTGFIKFIYNQISSWGKLIKSNGDRNKIIIEIKET